LKSFFEELLCAPCVEFWSRCGLSLNSFIVDLASRTISMFGSGTFPNVLLARAFPNVPSARAFSNVLAELALSLLERLLASGPPHSSKRCCTGMLQCCGNPWPAMHAQRVRAQACAPCVSLTAPSRPSLFFFFLCCCRSSACSSLHLHVTSARLDRVSRIEGPSQGSRAVPVPAHRVP
jgi:hypothetical protein